MTHSRREFGKLAMAGLAMSLPFEARSANIETTVRGVRLGITTGSLNPLPSAEGRDRLDIIIEQCARMGVGNIELAGGFFGLTRLLALSEDFRICLDLGHFTAGNNDAVKYLSEHHERITHVHVKDRKRNKGPNVEWGTGDTPIRECLTLIRDQSYSILCIIEREFKGTESPYEETSKNLDYMKKILLS